MTGQAQQRGLTSDDPHLQTFEIFMPRILLSNYRDNYYKEINQEISNQRNQQQSKMNTVQQTLTKESALPKNFSIEKVEEPGNFMNGTMQTCIEKARLEPQLYVRERGAIARLLGVTPELKNEVIPVLFKDPWMNFSNYFLCGLDFDFLMLDALVVTFIDIVASSDTTVRARLMLGILIAYILDSFLIFLRKYFGRRNLARHTLADERFLI